MGPPSSPLQQVWEETRGLLGSSAPPVPGPHLDILLLCFAGKETEAQRREGSLTQPAPGRLLPSAPSPGSRWSKPAPQAPRPSPGSTSRRSDLHEGGEHQRKPEPGVLQGRGAHRKGVVLRLAQRQREKSFRDRQGVHTPSLLGLGLPHPVFLRDPYLVWARSALRSQSQSRWQEPSSRRRPAGALRSA